jgi:hypothetical protein
MLRFSHQEVEENLDGVVSTIHQQVWLMQNQPERAPLTFSSPERGRRTSRPSHLFEHLRESRHSHRQPCPSPLPA